MQQFILYLWFIPINVEFELPVSPAGKGYEHLILANIKWILRGSVIIGELVQVGARAPPVPAVMMFSVRAGSQAS